MRKLVILSSLAALVACSSPPKPPTVDGDERKAINTTATASALAGQAVAAEARDSARDRPAPVPVAVQAAPVSRVVSVLFPYNVTKFDATRDQSAELLALRRGATRIEVRGRTDGKRPSDADTLVAMKRALAAKEFLVGHGVPAGIISVNYVSAGDYTSDNISPGGRAKNRRVDIEFFSSPL
jgi:outer membrane protein OmpA-like peptidoglycan-associated protein